MLVFYSAKGGAGCSVVAAATALLASADGPTLLVDFRGDQPELLGVGDGPPVPGLAEWASAASPPPDALRRLEVEVSARLSLLPAGVGGVPSDDDRIALLGRLLALDGRTVIVDVGRADERELALLAASERTILVTRACYLGLRAAMVGPTPDEVVLVSEPGRALGPGDVADALDVEMGPVIGWDPAIARAVDAGLLRRRMPRSLRVLETLVETRAS